MDRRSLVQLRTATDLVTSRVAVDMSLRQPVCDAESRDCHLTEDLRTRRQKLGLSIDEVSGRSGIDRESLSGWERGLAAPRIDAVQRWATALGLSFQLIPAERQAQRGLRVDWEARRIAVDGTPVRLTPMEWRALERLARVPGDLVTHRELFHHLYGDETRYRAQSTAIRVLITKLRRLLPLRIDAKWGKGYVVSGLDGAASAVGDGADDDGPTLRPAIAIAKNGIGVTTSAPRRDAPEVAALPIRREIAADDGMRRGAPTTTRRAACRDEELGVIERFLAERGVTRCPDVATIQQSPLPTLVWDKTKRKWVRPLADMGAR